MSKQQVHLKEKVIDIIETVFFAARLICIFILLVCIVVGQVPADQRLFFGMLTAFSVGGILLTSIILWVIEYFTNG